MLMKVKLIVHIDSDLFPTPHLSINSLDWQASLIALFMTHFLGPPPLSPFLPGCHSLFV